MNYLDYKELEKQVLESGDTDAICYLMNTCWGSNGENGVGVISYRLQSFIYTYSDLTDDERKQILDWNGLDCDDVLIGDDVYRVLGNIESKTDRLTKIDSIEPFNVLHQIHYIKTRKI